LSLVELRDVQKIYRMGEVDTPALRDVSLTIEKGAYVAIMGPSGSGKSTLMHILACLDVPSSGTYELNGRIVSSSTEDDLTLVRRHDIGIVFQSFNLLMNMTALENVGLPLLYRGASVHEQRAKARARLEAVGLGDHLAYRPGQLSGGQQQRVAIARALVTDPPLVLADEPTGNLDSRAGQEVLAIFDAIHEEGRTVIVITHDLQVALRSERIVELRDGVIVGDGEVAKA